MATYKSGSQKNGSSSIFGKTSTLKQGSSNGLGNIKPSFSATLGFRTAETTNRNTTPKATGGSGNLGTYGQSSTVLPNIALSDNVSKNIDSLTSSLIPTTEKANQSAKGTINFSDQKNVYSGLTINPNYATGNDILVHQPSPGMGVFIHNPGPNQTVYTSSTKNMPSQQHQVGGSTNLGTHVLDTAGVGGSQGTSRSGSTGTTNKTRTYSSGSTGTYGSGTTGGNVNTTPSKSPETNNSTSGIGGNTTKPTESKSNEEIAQEVMAGKWGTGEERRKRLEDTGYSYDEIQKIVNQEMPTTEKATPSNQRTTTTSSKPAASTGASTNTTGSSSNLGGMVVGATGNSENSNNSTTLISNAQITYAGTTNGDFVPLENLGTHGQGDIVSISGEVADPKDQEYLYRLSQITGMDYPLLMGLWCSESGARRYLYPPEDNGGGTFGLTYGATFDIINNGYVKDSGSGKVYQNNFKDAINNAVTQAYMETFGVEPPPETFSKGNVYYDSAVASCSLTDMWYDWTGGGKSTVDTMDEAFRGYTGFDSKPFQYYKPLNYATQIRNNLGWESVDYQTVMKNQHNQDKFTRNLDW